MRPMKLILSAASLFIAVGSTAKADIIVTLTGPAMAVAGGYDWTYQATLTSAETLPVGTTGFFTINDISTTPVTLLSTTADLTTDFSYNSSLTNVPAFNTSPPDSASLYNMQFQFIGSTALSGHGASLVLGDFTIQTTSNLTQVLTYDGQATSTDLNTPDGNNGPVLGPTFASPVPEPASMLLFGAGLVALLLIKGKKDGMPILLR